MPHPGPLTITAQQIAEDLDVNVHTIRRLFRRNVLHGEKVGLDGWTMPRDDYTAWLRTWQPDITANPLTTQQIADKLGVHVLTVRRMFTLHGAPGKKLRSPVERTASWRTTPDAFWTWHTAYRSGRRTAAAPTPEQQQATPV